jgi:hypothetical protein
MESRGLTQEPGGSVDPNSQQNSRIRSSEMDQIGPIKNMKTIRTHGESWSGLNSLLYRTNIP